MPSPFPGMDPYLDAHWRDVHAGLIIYARDALNGVLPKSLRARVEESVLLETPEGIGPHPLYPDVRVIEYSSKRVPGIMRESSEPTDAGVAVMEPLLVETAVEPATETFIEIIDRESGNHVVTVIEFLSPSNKSPGANRELYRRKQREICSSNTNLVEIDLNRFGTHTLAFPLGHIRPQGRSGYMVCIRRVTLREQAQVYPLKLWDRLPVIKIPLRPGDADVLLNLQSLVDQCYVNGGYEGTLDYSIDPEPPLLGDERDWAEEHLRALGLRPQKAARRKGKAKA